MYTVVVNNNYHSLDGIVGFYANGELIDSVNIIELKKEEAKQLAALWTPREGTYTLTARFIEATAIDESGNRTRLELGALNDIGDVPIAVGSNQNTNEPTKTDTKGTAQTSEPSESTDPVIVQVEKQGQTTTVTPVPPANNTATVQQLRKAFTDVEKFINVVTTSAGTIEETYQTTKEWVGKAEAGYTTAKNLWGTTKIYGGEGKKIINGWWAEPKTRKIIIGTGIVLLFLSIGVFFRRRGDLDTW